MTDGLTLRLDFTGIDGQPVRPPPKIVTYPDCGGRRYAHAIPHSQHWRDGQLVDCVGRNVTPEPK